MEYYTLPVDPRYGLTEIQFTWTRRTIASYTPLQADINKTIWRCAKTGEVSAFSQKMVSSIGKAGGIVIEDFVEVSTLPLSTQHKLALEQLGRLQEQIMLLRNSLLAKKIRANTGASRLNAIAENICKELKFYPSIAIEDVLQATQAVIGDFEIELGEDAAVLVNIFDQQRFSRLNELAKASQWADNCCLLWEIAEKRLYRFGFDSFESYCKSTKISGGSRRVKIGRLINRLNAANLPIPANKCQASAIAQIPSENQLQVWQQSLELQEQGRKLTAAIISDIHRKLIHQQIQQPQVFQDLSLVVKKIELLLNEYKYTLSKPVTDFLNSLDRTRVSALEAKMLRSLLNGLRQQLEQGEYAPALIDKPKAQIIPMPPVRSIPEIPIQVEPCRVEVAC